MRVLLCLMGLLLGTWAAQAAERPPNIILFVVDDLGWSDPGFMGNPWHETPAMDQLAREGAVFTQAYAAAPVCRPSRASLLTGLYPPRHHIYSVFRLDDGPRDEHAVITPPSRIALRPDIPTLAKRLKDRGYATALIGKWDLGEGNSSPEAHGFDHNMGGFQGGILPHGYFSPYGLPGIQDTHANEYLTDRLAQEAATFITEQREKPFFLMLSHYAVHLPFEAPRNTVRHFRNKPRPVHHHNATYAAMLKHVDDSLVRVRETLLLHGLSNNTLIIFTSDNGGVPDFLGSTSQLRGAKSSFLENGIRVPLVMHWPGRIPASQRIEMPTGLIDVTPTVLAASNNEDDFFTDGLDLWPCVLQQDKGCADDRPLFWHFPGYIAYALSADFFSARPQSIIRQGPWKLVQNLETGSLSLFNIITDPLEKHDLADEKNDIASMLLSRLTAWQEEIKAPIPQPNPDYRSLRGWPRLKIIIRMQWEKIFTQTVLTLTGWLTS